MKAIEITVSPTGESRIETKGFAGGECQDASRLIEQALGRVTSERLTSEFYATNLAERHEPQQE